MIITLAEKAVPYSTSDLFKKMGINLPAAALPGAKRGTKRPPRNTEITTNTANESDIPEGSRNATLASLAGSMRHRGMSPESIFAALQQENIARCNPPLDEDEVCRIAQSISRFTPDEVASRPVFSRADIAKLIEATDDFDELTSTIAGQVTHSNLRDSEKELLRKAIAKKASVSLATIKQDAKHQSTAGDKFDHLTTALEVKNLFGQGNLIHAQNSVWCWVCGCYYKADTKCRTTLHPTNWRVRKCGISQARLHYFCGAKWFYTHHLPSRIT